MPYQHGVRTSEVATSILPTTEVDSALPVIVGTAPVCMTDPTNVNKPVLCHSYDEFVQQFGYVPPALNSASGLQEYAFTLCEAAYALFALFNVGPAVFINVLDPTTHKKTATTVPPKPPKWAKLSRSHQTRHLPPRRPHQASTSTKLSKTHHPPNRLSSPAHLPNTSHQTLQALNRAKATAQEAIAPPTHPLRPVPEFSSEFQ